MQLLWCYSIQTGQVLMWLSFADEANRAVQPVLTAHSVVCVVDAVFTTTWRNEHSKKQLALNNLTSDVDFAVLQSGTHDTSYQIPTCMQCPAPLHEI